MPNKTAVIMEFLMRVLIFGMTENPGGVESFIINYYRHLDREKIQFDFLCNSYNPVAYENEIKKLGGRCFHIIARSVDYWKYKKELDSVFKKHASEWDAIWVNVCSLANIDYLKMAKKYGLNRRIIHSHNSQNMDSKLRGLLHFLNKRGIGSLATDYWACSYNAARWFFSGDERQKAVVIHNAIDVNLMQFNEEKRNNIRRQYDWNDKYVIGNIGRFHFQKNQSFMLDVFANYFTRHSDSVLVLIGQGHDEEMLRAKANRLKIDKKVFFVGIQSDIQGWLSCFDLFLFPSVFEGLSVAALEAQANSVPVLASRGVVPDDIKMNKNFVLFDLALGDDAWSSKIDEMRLLQREAYDRVKQNFVKKGYDIETEVGRLEDLLLR